MFKNKCFCVFGMLLFVSPKSSVGSEKDLPTVIQIFEETPDYIRVEEQTWTSIVKKAKSSQDATVELCRITLSDGRVFQSEEKCHFLIGQTIDVDAIESIQWLK